MAKAKSVVKRSDEEWKTHVVTFTYNEKAYKVPVKKNLILDDLSVGEIKDYLNELPGRLSYWKSFQVQIAREIANMDMDFERWFQTKYMELDVEYGKKTEGWKKSRIMLDNAEQYRKRRKAILDLKDVHQKVDVIVSGYNTMTWTLREVARLTYAEMSNIELRGKGDLSEY
jgi:hypothetical protein